ncbi:hypothetical protein NL463_28700, partial [Klebsiella pneumoniae]|nr:hypothetical protein [Klebsiella pneumoniae]
FLARFKQEPFSTVTADADLLKVTGFANADKPGAGRVVMRLTDGKPWLAAKVVGEGEVIFAGTALDETWGNWPAKAGSFVSFVQFTL